MSHHHELYKNLPQGVESWPGYCEHKKGDGIRFVAVDLEKQKPNTIFFKAHQLCQLFSTSFWYRIVASSLHSLPLIKQWQSGLDPFPFSFFSFCLALPSVGSMLIAWKKKSRGKKKNQLKNTNTSDVIFLFYVKEKNISVFRSDQGNTT